MRWIVMVPILLYRMTLSKIMPPICRFQPTCSEYGLEAIRRHGSIRGIGLTVWRVLRCQPFCKGGYDPVPDVETPAGTTPPSDKPSPRASSTASPISSDDATP